MTAARRKARVHYPTLRDQKTRVLDWAVGYLVGEVQACDDGIVPAMRDTFLALALLVDAELRLRNIRRTTHRDLRKYVRVVEATAKERKGGVRR